MSIGARSSPRHCAFGKADIVLSYSVRLHNSDASYNQLECEHHGNSNTHQDRPGLSHLLRLHDAGAYRRLSPVHRAEPPAKNQPLRNFMCVPLRTRQESGISINTARQSEETDNRLKGEQLSASGQIMAKRCLSTS